MCFRVICIFRMTCLLGVGLTLPGAANAQDSASGAEEIRVSCDRATLTLKAGGPTPEKMSSIVTMQQCGNEGVRTLVTQWERPTLDTVLLPALANASAVVNDRRTYQAARAVALDPSRSESSRLAALTVLVAGFDRKLAVTFPTPTKPMQSTYVALGRNFHPPTKKAPQPVGLEARTDVLSVLKELADSDPNERIRKVAGELGPLLKRQA